MSNAQLEPLLAGEPQDVQAEILSINKEARDRSLQVALLVPLLASLLGLLNAFRMRRLPDPDRCRLRRRHGAGLSAPMLSALPGARLVSEYRSAWLRKDLVAGLVLVALLVPQGMAYAELAGLPPITGLYTSILCLIGYAVFGPSRILVLGPDSSLGPMIAADDPAARRGERRSGASGRARLDARAARRARSWCSAGSSSSDSSPTCCRSRP